MDASETQLVVLPPSRSSVPKLFRRVDADSRRHGFLLAEMQRFRGRIYLQDGAIRPRDLTLDGRHCLSIDESSWHLLAMTEAGEVCGCARYCPHENSVGFSDLWLRHAALARSPEWGQKLRRAVERELFRARGERRAYAEVGGWAITEERRWTCDALRIALGTYAMARCLGGCLGITNATVRHCSASILRRLGGRPLEFEGDKLPPYYDPQYGCWMEMLRFDSALPNPKYEEWIARLGVELETVPVICPKDRPSVVWQPMRVPFEVPAAGSRSPAGLAVA
jgi:hypothetical protein